MSQKLVTSLNRYLIHFSYIGTKFSGVARQKNTNLTIANTVEDCIQNLRPFCELESNFFISSRTDAGVHALENTGHFDLKFNEESLKSNLQDDRSVLKTFQSQLNKIFIQKDHAIRILSIQQVSPDFLSRHAKYRTYFYRLGLLENGKKLFNDYQNVKKVESVLYPHLNKFDPPSSFFTITNFTTAFERNLITEIREPFDYKLFLKALALYNGQHNFSAFTTADGRQEMHKSKKNPIKTVRAAVTRQAPQFLRNHTFADDDKCNVIEIEIKAESFLYKMIRKMVGTAVDVAKGLIPLSQIECMMLCPPDFYTTPSTTILKPDGLFLKKVHYDPKQLFF